MKLTTMIERLGPVLADAIYERFDEIGIPQEDKLMEDDVRGIKEFLRGKKVLWTRVSRRSRRLKKWNVHVGFIDPKKLKHFC